VNRSGILGGSLVFPEKLKFLLWTYTQSTHKSSVSQRLFGNSDFQIHSMEFLLSIDLMMPQKSGSSAIEQPERWGVALFEAASARIGLGKATRGEPAAGDQRHFV
jgi:hypothetical protein